ncbi:MAG: OmpA family protein [Nitrospirae bacterium]|nr:OmpA family protein [Nitrospirota bacterium]
MRKKRIEDQDNPDRWVVSYADFVTLLFAFFTTMYAISQVDAGKLKMFTGSMKSAFRSEDARTVKPVIEGIVPVAPEMISVEEELRRSVAALQAKDDMEISRDERGVILSIGDNVLFDVGKAGLRQEASASLGAVASLLKKLPNNVIVEGHTDNIPITDTHARYASNWELSTARATSVLSYLLTAYNLPPERFAAAGYAEFRPKATNATSDGRIKNRRVDIIILGRNR